MRGHKLRFATSFLAVLFSLAIANLHADDAPAGSSVDLEKLFAGEAPKDVAELRAMQHHVRELSAKLLGCTVGVRVGEAQGSGVIVSKDGYVMTAGHVVGKPDQDVVFILSDGKIVRGKSLGMNRGIDSGLMKISAEGDWPYVEMGNSEEVKEGQWVLATGHPGGYERGRNPVVRLGRVLSNRDSVIITDCTLVGGDSGGPLFDMDGKVIAIHSRIGGSLTENIHVPTKTYQDTWDRLAKGDDWGYLPGGGPYIGVVAEPDSDVAKIAEVYPGTPAEKAGIKAGDVILKFADKEITDFDSLRGAVGETGPGDKVQVQVRRGEEILELDLVVGRRGG